VLAIKSAGDEFRVPLLWNHDSWSPAIGVARCFREGTEWLMEPIFDEVCDTSKMVAAKVKAGTLNQCSIRFIPADSEPVPNAEGGYDFPLVETLEVSIVNIGGNQEAVRLRSAEPVAEDEEAKYRAAGLAFRAKVEGALDELRADVVKLHKLLPVEEEEPALDEEPTETEDEEPAPKEEEEREAPEDKEPATEKTEPPPGEEETADELPDEEAKALRVRLTKRFGFTSAQLKSFSGSELRKYAALLPPVAK
ncbi:primosomal replication protein N, partial [Myxococcus llanfairpwllgwyngyllgogerychwyrndrobwllllantysiliogogogochensis]